MDNHLPPLGRHALHSDFQQNYSLTAGLLGLLVPQQQQRQPSHIEYQQGLSPAHPMSRGSSYTGSPMSPSTVHHPVVSQPSGGLQPSYTTGPNGILQSMGSPVSPTYGQPVSDSMNPGLSYAYDSNFGDMQMHVGNGLTRSRNNSENMANLQFPTPRQSTAGSINQSELSYQEDAALSSLSSFAYSNTHAPTNMPTQEHRFSPTFSAPFIQAIEPSPPIQTPVIRTTRRTRRSHRNDEPIGFVFSDKKKFKCSKDECKDSTFGRMADLRRHWDQAHAKNRQEYYCSVAGCPRAHAPTGGRGRSFGARKDKRDEHERNVHKKPRPCESSYSSDDNV